ncbi:MAG: hypothetical protein AAGD10_00865 [Myxococcota bacterium]
MRPLEARLPELRRWARRYASGPLSADDLVAWAALGILEAGAEHDGRFGLRARGAMLDALRRECGRGRSSHQGEDLPAPLWTDERWEARRRLRRLFQGFEDLDPESRGWLRAQWEGAQDLGPVTASGRRKRARRVRSRLALLCGGQA